MSYTNHSLPYDQQDDMQPQYPDFNHYPSDRLADSAAEGRTVLYPSQLHPHPLFTRQGNAGPSIRNRSLELHHAPYGSPSPFTPQQSWPPYDNAQNYPYPPYPSPSPFPAPRLSPPPVHHSPVNFKSHQNNSDPPSSSQNHRLTLAGSLDPSTGIFYRTPEHPRLRTAQACEKCRTRKAKCSGEHPACKRCLTRGLICEYAKEGRVRGPNKAKSKPSNSGNDASSNTPSNIRNGPRGRTSSVESSHSPYQPHRERHIHIQKNMTAIQTHSQRQSTPSSSSSQGRLLQGMPHIQTDHLLTLGMPYSASPLQSPSMSDEFMYPSPSSYMQQPFPHYPVGNGSRNAISATTGGSPHTSVSGGTSVINSPLTPASASVPSYVISPSTSRISMKMDLDMTCVDPTLRGPESGLGGSASIPIEPVWIDHLGQVNTYPQLNSNSEHPIQGTDERGQSGLSTQIEVMDGSVFMKNGRGHSQQDQFHGQSQSHNETQHYDLQMC